MAELLHLSVRLLHVLAMALLTGGAALLWLGFRRATATAETALVVATAVGYEWVFWAAAGLLVATGVGNLGALAPGVPGPDTDWGLTFAVKLVAVVAFLAASVVRTVMVDRLDRIPVSHNDAIRRRLGRSYAATAIALAGVVALAEVLAHG